MIKYYLIINTIYIKLPENELLDDKNINTDGQNI